jgi:alkylation response protein AidB-like acyl-CoA dehydrogenase
LDLNDTPELAEYREGIRGWLEEHRDEAPVIRGEGRSRTSASWWPRGALAAQARRGRARGRDLAGRVRRRGLGPLHQVVVNQEIGRAGVPGSSTSIGVGMLGPTIIAHGTEEQKQRHLGPMLAGDEVWCQLFSEPAAGSDLAGIQTRAPPATTARGGSRPEGLDDERAARAFGCCSRAPTPTCPSTRA